MSKIYPTDDKIVLMLADSIRIEASNKITIIGYLGDSQINLLQPVKFPAGIPLAVLFMLRDGEGTFQGHFQIVNSHNVVIIDAPLASDVIKISGLAANVIVNITQLVVAELGDYTFILNLDQAQYRRVVHVVANQTL